MESTTTMRYELARNNIHFKSGYQSKTEALSEISARYNCGDTATFTLYSYQEGAELHQRTYITEYYPRNVQSNGN